MLYRAVIRDSQVVRYVGAVPEIGAGVFVGVEYNKPHGTTNGTAGSKRYFTCREKYGSFVPQDSVSPYSDEAKAAIGIQASMRSKMAKDRVDREATLAMYNMLDNHEEQKNLERRSKLGRKLSIGGEEIPGSEIGDGEVDGIEVTEDYEGPHVTWDLSSEVMEDLLAAFKADKLLHAKYVLQILTKFNEHARTLPSVVQVHVDEGCRFTVVGDTHGQLADVLHIFEINGVPSPFNQYLFNGDFVDRGDYGVEIAMLIFGYKLLYPTSVHINRGNHECRSQTQVQGFMMEVLDKYNAGAAAGGKNRGNQIYDMFQKCFDALPLCTVLQDHVFVVHGGLFERRGIRISHLEAVNRFREIPLTRGTFEDGLFQDMMWSDPQDARGVRPSSRGAGHFFGQDVTQAFCKANDIHLVIRSHECVPDGFEFTHGSQLLTLFSASDYCGDTGNMGAFVVFKSDMKANIEQFMAAGQEEESPTRLARTHKAVIAKLVDLICGAKPDLYWYFTHLDRMHSGCVSRVEWADALKTVLHLDLPFMRLVNDLATVEPDGTINYARFLERYKIEMPKTEEQYLEAVVEKVYEKLVVLCSDLEEAYKLFDVNEDGTVEYKEFVAALKKLDLGLTEQQLYNLMGHIDTDKDSHINFAEFAGRFEVVLQKMGGGTGDEVPLDAEMKRWVGQVGTALFKGGAKAKEVFKRLDTDSSGTLSYDEFQVGLKGLGLDFTKEQAERIAKVIDTDNDGEIAWAEFIAAFKVRDRSAVPPTPKGARGGAGGAAEESGPWTAHAIDGVIALLYDYRVELAASFRLFDTDNSGKVSAEEFKKGLEALRLPLQKPLTDDQIAELIRLLDTDGDGQLSYDEFLNGFSVRNTETGAVAKQSYKKRA